MEILKALNVIHAPVRAISGAVSEGEDILKRSQEVFVPGSVRYLGPESLRAFGRLRNNTYRVLRQYGVRFLSGYAVPDSRLDAAQDALAQIRAEVDAEKRSLLDNFEGHVDAWVAKHPEVQPFRSKFPSKVWIASRVGMTVAVYKIEPGRVTAGNDGIVEEVGGLSGRVLEEVAQDIEESWSPGAPRATQRIRHTLKRAIDKLQSLAFIDADLGMVAGMVENVLAQMPPSGSITGHDYIVLSGLLNTLLKPASVVVMARSLAEGQNAYNIWKPIVEILPENRIADEAVDAQPTSTGGDDQDQDGANDALNESTADSLVANHAMPEAKSASVLAAWGW